jgi:hypothetical protein
MHLLKSSAIGVLITKPNVMKKIILGITLFVFMAGSIIAQNDPGPSLGAKAGFNFSNVYDSDAEVFSADGKFGFAAGAFAHFPIGDYVGFQPEVLFSQKGYTASGSFLGSSYSYTRTTNFIDIPLFLAVKPIPQMAILAGPQFSYLVERTDDFQSELINVQQIEEFENDNIRRNILGAVAGLDFDLHPVVIGARVGWDLQTNNGDGSSQTPRYKNTWLQATVGFNFM